MAEHGAARCLTHDAERELRQVKLLELLKQHIGERRAPLRRLLSMLQDYPRAAFLAALEAAEHYRLFDLDRLERMVLKRIAEEYFVTPFALTPPHEADDE